MKKKDLGNEPYYKSARRFFGQAVQKSLYPESVRLALVDVGLLKHSEPVMCLLDRRLELLFDFSEDKDNILAMGLLKFKQESFSGIDANGLLQINVSETVMKSFITVCSVCSIDVCGFSDNVNEIMIQTSAISVLDRMVTSLKIVERRLKAVCFVPNPSAGFGEDGPNYEGDYGCNEDDAVYAGQDNLSYVTLNVNKFVIF